MDDRELLEKLQKIERLYAGATTPGEKNAAADAMDRIRKRLRETEKVEKAIEFKFHLNDDWSKKLFLALVRRYHLRPYRYARQRRTTVMARMPPSFMRETLWPEYLELSEVLRRYLNDMTNRVIAQAIHKDEGEEEVMAESLP